MYLNYNSYTSSSVFGNISEGMQQMHYYLVCKDINLSGMSES